MKTKKTLPKKGLDVTSGPNREESEPHSSRSGASCYGHRRTDPQGVAPMRAACAPPSVTPGQDPSSEGSSSFRGLLAPPQRQNSASAFRTPATRPWDERDDVEIRELSRHVACGGDAFGRGVSAVRVDLPGRADDGCRILLNRGARTSRDPLICLPTGLLKPDHAIALPCEDSCVEHPCAGWG
jgi:hypothetical protein